MESLSIKTVLCPVDLGESSGAIIQWAGLFSKKYSAGLEVFHAQWLEAPVFFTHSQVESLRKETWAQLEKVKASMTDLSRKSLSPGTPFDIRVVEGHAVTAIEERLAKGGIDLVVMGSHGRSGTARLMLGSVAENIVRSAACPVLIARATGKGEPPAIRKILCPSDFSEEAARTLDVCAALGLRFGAEITVLHAVEDGTSVEGASTRLCDWVSGETRSLCRVTEVVREGSAAEQIVALATGPDFDLIVLGAEHKPFLQFTTIGTTTEKVMRHSPISVLVIPAGGPTAF